MQRDPSHRGATVRKDLGHSKLFVSASKKPKTVLDISVENFICRKFREMTFVKQFCELISDS